MIKTLLLCALLATPLMTICFLGEFVVPDSFSEYLLLSQFSLGNLGEYIDGWANIPLKELTENFGNFTLIPLNCNSNDSHPYSVAHIAYFGVSRHDIQNKTQFHRLGDDAFEEFEDHWSCLSFLKSFEVEFQNECHKTSECPIHLSLESSECREMLRTKTEEIEAQNGTAYLVTNFKCVVYQPFLFFDGFHQRKIVISFAWVTWDCMITVIIALLFRKLNYYMRKEASRIKKNRMTADYFTVQIKNIPQLSPLELYGEIFNFFENLSPKTQVADIGIGMADKLLEINFQIGKLRRRLAMIEKKYVKLTQESQNSKTGQHIENLKKEHMRIVDTINGLDKKQEAMEARSLTVKTVFVTFVKEEGAEYTVHNYTKFANSNFLFRSFRQGKIKKF